MNDKDLELLHKYETEDWRKFTTDEKVRLCEILQEKRNTRK